MKNIIKQQRGSMLLESMIAILIFSMGILALVALLGASVKNVSNAKYRTEASLLVNQIIGEMWTSDKTTTALAEKFSTDGALYTVWKTRVADTLPGVSDEANAPAIVIVDDAGVPTVTVTVFWQAPGDPGPHNYVAVTRVHN